MRDENIVARFKGKDIKRPDSIQSPQSRSNHCTGSIHIAPSVIRMALGGEGGAPQRPLYPPPSSVPPSHSVLLTALSLRHSRALLGNPGYSVCVNPVRHSRRSPIPSFSPAGGNPGWCFPIRNWIPGDAPRMTEGRKTRTTPTMAAWIPEQGSRMTEGKEGLDSRGCPENDGGRKCTAQRMMAWIPGVRCVGQS